MRIPPYWASGSHAGVDRRGKERTFRAWGWSFESLTAAKEEAAARAKRIYDCLSSGSKPDSYDYLEHPLREEIVESVGASGETTAVITRNRYGALVLNCRPVCFVDVDFPRAKAKGVLDALLTLFSPRRRRDRARAMHEATVERIRDWSGRHPQRSFRLYRTAAGLRLLFTDRCYDPVSEEVSDLLRELGSDLLYRKLTEKQECFRARLTPKPWRCGCRPPPNRYPWETADAERRYRAWQQEYEEKSQGYGICRLLETLGSPSAAEPFAGVISLHDRYTCRGADATLA